MTEEGRYSKENADNIKNKQVEENCLADLSGKNQASSSDCEKKMSEENNKGDGETQRFKRKFSCVSSSQPICKNDMESSNTTNWFVEYKKQAQLAKKMRLRADRANEKLEQVRSQLKIINDIVTK